MTADISKNILIEWFGGQLEVHDSSLPPSQASLITARIVSVSDICNMWSLDNLLLYTTLTLSIVAMSASFVWRPQGEPGNHDSCDI